MKGKKLRDYLINQCQATFELFSKQTFFNLKMSQDISTEKKKVEVVTFPHTGDKALLIDGELYKMEVMFYKWNPNDEVKETNHSVSDLKMQIIDYGVAEIEKLD